MIFWYTCIPKNIWKNFREVKVEDFVSQFPLERNVRFSVWFHTCVSKNKHCTICWFGYQPYLKMMDVMS